MIRYECDRCGVRMRANDARRYIVKLEVYAAAGNLELDLEDDSDTDAALDSVMEALRNANPDDVEDETYRSFRFDVCNDCRRQLIAKPLG